MSSSAIIITVLEEAAASGIVLVAAALFVRTLKFPKKVMHMMDDWLGEEARPGVPSRPGVMERLFTMEHDVTTIKHEVQFNSGGSIKDAVHRTDESVHSLKETLDAHIVQSTVLQGQLFMKLDNDAKELADHHVL